MLSIFQDSCTAELEDMVFFHGQRIKHFQRQIENIDAELVRRKEAETIEGMALTTELA